MSIMYEGIGLKRDRIGECKGGCVYRGIGLNRTIVGTYGEDGSIYRGRGLKREYVGKYENGYIYIGQFNRSIVGVFQNGYVYQGHTLNKTAIGMCQDGISAAAMLLLRDELFTQDNKSSAPKSNYKGSSAFGEFLIFFAVLVVLGVIFSIGKAGLLLLKIPGFLIFMVSLILLPTILVKNAKSPAVKSSEQREKVRKSSMRWALVGTAVVAMITAISCSWASYNAITFLCLPVDFLTYLCTIRYFMNKSETKADMAFASGAEPSGAAGGFKEMYCPSCGALLRVPAGKGRVKVTCPKCGGSFMDNT